MASQANSRSILVVDDDDDCRESLSEYLAATGHRVTTAADGPSGLEKIQADTPDVALIDISLPGFDGHELARRVRKHVGAGPFLVALTGYSGEEVREGALAAGFDEYFAKPIDLDKLSRLLQEPRRKR